jgi:micrococcal nuclease|tara:strand:- start:80 stop:436 length:357 start_codon:yes stop_codon:yes gene_type:complete
VYTYKAKLVRVVDGDTLDVFVDLGFNVWIKRRVRLVGIDAYETRTRNKEEKKKGLAAKARLKEILEDEDKFSLISHGVGKYGRCLGEIHITAKYIKSSKYHGKSINEMMVKEGHAKAI